jgi:hypothetical protein
MNSIEEITQSICDGSEEPEKHNKNIILVLDTSGSTYSIIKDGLSILQRCLELVKEFAEQNPDNNYRLITFSNDAIDYGNISMLEGVAMIQRENAIISGGGTNTASAFEYIWTIYEAFKPQKIFCWTDGQTNSSSIQITNCLSKLKKKNIKISFIAVSDTSFNMETITAREESTIPGMDVINYAGNLIDELIIYNKHHYDVPFQGARKTMVDKNRLRFFDCALPKSEGEPHIYVFTNFIKELLAKIGENISTINWGSKDRSFKKLCAEIGILLIIFDTSSYPEHNSYIIKIAQRLSEMVPSYPTEKIIEYFKYGYNCSRGSKPILYTNMEGHVQESAVKQKAFADAANLLLTEGTVSGSSMAISFPINGKCLIIEQEA